MQSQPTNTNLNRTMKLTALTVLTHALLPLLLLPLSLYAMPQFVTAFETAGMPAAPSLRVVLHVTSFVGGYWHFYIIILAAAVVADAAICFSLFRSGRKIAADLWSGFVILTQAVFAALCALAFSQVWAD